MAEETNFSQGEAEEVKYQERKRLLFFGLPWTFTKYTISQDMITVDEGLIKVEENDCYMYKVQDVKLTATLPERIFGIGNDHLLHRRRDRQGTSPESYQACKGD